MNATQEYRVTWFRADSHAEYGTYETGPFVNYVMGTSAADVRKRMNAEDIVSRVQSVRSTEAAYARRVARAERARNYGGRA